MNKKLNEVQPDLAAVDLIDAPDDDANDVAGGADDEEPANALKLPADDVTTVLA